MNSGKQFRDYDLDQVLLLPPNLNDWLPADHLARFIADVVKEIDLSEFFASYSDPRGAAAYHPRMMLSLLIYGYCTGTFSSRKLALACQENVAFRFLSGNTSPRHSALADFRRRHLDAMASLFTSVFMLCRESGLVSLGHVSIDGSKFKANASKHKAVSWSRIDEREEHYKAKAGELLKQAEMVDLAEDKHHGKDNNGPGLPEELQRAEGRIQRIREAREALKTRARKQAEAKQQAVKKRLEERKAIEEKMGKKLAGNKPKAPDPEQATPEDRDQYNFTDPESRIMKDSATGSFMPAYNAHTAVDETNNIIIGTQVNDRPNDQGELIPTLATVLEQTNGDMPNILSADAGYFSEKAITNKAVKDCDLYIPPRKPGKKQSHVSADLGSNQDPPKQNPTEQMRSKLQSEEGKEIYKMRKAIVEGPFGIIKSVMGFRTFSVRGLKKIQGEWNLVTAAYNMRKLFKAG